MVMNSTRAVAVSIQAVLAPFRPGVSAAAIPGTSRASVKKAVAAGRSEHLVVILFSLNWLIIL